MNVLKACGDVTFSLKMGQLKSPSIITRASNQHLFDFGAL